jgi:hypothetical protein
MNAELFKRVKAAVEAEFCDPATVTTAPEPPAPLPELDSATARLRTVLDAQTRELIAAREALTRLSAAAAEREAERAAKPSAALPGHCECCRYLGKPGEAGSGDHPVIFGEVNAWTSSGIGDPPEIRTMDGRTIRFGGLLEPSHGLTIDAAVGEARVRVKAEHLFSRGEVRSMRGTLVESAESSLSRRLAMKRVCDLLLSLSRALARDT